ncbi:MAG: ABC transporter ATP-binding protein [Clostridiales bacterium]|nr:ABC transporter ATP-binding protein [Clostridiales bacterium]
MQTVSIESVRKAFEGRVVLDGVSFSIEPGETVCLMAPSGAGKTTLINILLGLLRPDSGTVTGLERASTGVVFQEDRLIEDMDAVSNIRLVNTGLSRERVVGELGRMGLAGSEAQPVRELSGGMRRRVCLLRALMSGAEFLVLDEPFNGLDEDTRGIAIARTKALAAGRPVLMVTHDPEAAALMGARVVRLRGTAVV